MLLVICLTNVWSLKGHLNSSITLKISSEWSLIFRFGDGNVSILKHLLIIWRFIQGNRYSTLIFVFGDRFKVSDPLEAPMQYILAARYISCKKTWVSCKKTCKCCFKIPKINLIKAVILQIKSLIKRNYDVIALNLFIA